MQITRFNEEVLFTKDPITSINRIEIDELKTKARSNIRKRIRLCSHLDITDQVHEMLIVHSKNNYIRPHKHIGKSESFHIIEGALDIIIFNDQGVIEKVNSLNEFGSGLPFYFRLSSSIFHTIVPKTDMVVFHETTSGPFVPKDTIFPNWAPSEDQDESIKLSYIYKLLDRASEFMEQNN